MLIAGLPTGTSLLERFQWEYLRMNNVQSVRIANRLAQLFGRINRGRNDYGVFLIEGSEINNWLGKDRNVALLPPLLQKQIIVSRTVQQDMDLRDVEQEYCRQRNISQRTAQRDRQLRQSPPYAVVGNKVYYRIEAVREWLRNLERNVDRRARVPRAGDRR